MEFKTIYAYVHTIGYYQFFGIIPEYTCNQIKFTNIIAYYG